MYSLELTLLFVLSYTIWAAVLSDSRFHRVWSVALLLLRFLTTRLFDQPFSVSSVPLAMLVLLVFIVCIILSPAQLLLFNTKSIVPKKKALRTYGPKDEELVSVDIVAVHGLEANPETTWMSRLPGNNITAGNDQAMWLRDFLPNEQDINARVMTFNHNTSWTAYALDKSLHDHGDDLLQALRAVRQGDARHRPIIFVGHSFGGLIVKQALVNAGADSADDFCRNTRQKARGFIFLGTPHKGARIAILGQIWSLLGFWRGSSTVLLEVIKPGSAINQNMHSDFMGYLQSDGPGTNNTLCVYEAVKQRLWGMPIIHVVDKDSAIIDGSHKIGFETDHRNMQRFPNQEDENYSNILVWIKRWMEQAKEEALKNHTAKAQEKTLEQQECLKSLYFLNMDQREYTVEDAATKTCSWLLNHGEYTTWLAQPHTLLWIVGKPGAGKSTLIRYALQKTSHSNDVVATFFFFGRGSDLQKNACGLFRSLLHQLLDQSPELLSKFILIYKKKREAKQKSESELEWHETELRELLQDWILSASRDRAIRIYLDALDEAGQEVAVKLVTYFEELIERLHPTRAGFRICFSCRHYPVLAPKNALKVCVEEENHHDIVTYVRQRMTKYQLSDPEEGRKLEQEIIEKSSRIFQWVVLIIPIIIQSDNDGASVTKIRQKLKEIPHKLSDLYEHILSNIGDPKRSAQLMQWVCFAMRPLSLEELRYAMVVDITKDFRSLNECQNSVDFAETDEQMRRTVNSLSGGLAETVEYEDRQTVRFIHQSVSDYLIESGLQILDSSFFQDVNAYLRRSKLPILERSLSDNVVGLAHFRISRSCVRFINLKEVLEETKELSRDVRRVEEIKKRELIRRFPFLQYCASWASHAEIVEKQRMPQADLITFFRWPSEDGIRSWVIFFDQLKLQDGQKGTLLLFASKHGLLSVIEAIIDSGANLNFNTKEFDGRTPFPRAVEEGHEAVVRLLNERHDVDIDTEDYWGHTPLFYAAREGHEAVVRLLIERGVEVNSRSNHGETPFSIAVQCEQEVVVRLLIERDDVETDSRDNEGRTPFSFAAEGGQEVIVRLLIERGVEIDSRDNEGQTPLSWAAEGGHEAIVRLLIERDVEIDSRDNWGRAPLSWAAGGGYEAIVQLLIERGVKIDLGDNWGRAPLSWAAGGGDEAIVRLLIERGVEIDSRDNEERTPLLWAAWMGHEAIVRLLIEGHAEINSKDNGGRAPLSWAAGNGHEAVVRLLIERGVEIDSRDNKGRTPLSRAVNYGHEAVTRLLIEQDDIDIESKDIAGLTPLDHARKGTRAGYNSVVKLLKTEFKRRKNQPKK